MSGQYKQYQFPTILNGDVFILNTRKGILTLLGSEAKLVVTSSALMRK
jgi:hypothetical protein